MKTIVLELGVSENCIQQTWRRHQKGLPVEGDYRNAGRKRCTSLVDDRRMESLAKRNRCSSLPDLQRDMADAGVRISVSTISRRLRAKGLNSYGTYKKPLLTKISAKVRKLWCKERKHWSADRWASVIFSDESCFELFPSSGKVRVRRLATQKYLPESVRPQLQGGGGKLMVWGPSVGGAWDLLFLLMERLTRKNTLK